MVDGALTVEGPSLAKTILKSTALRPTWLGGSLNHLSTQNWPGVRSCNYHTRSESQNRCRYLSKPMVPQIEAHQSWLRSLRRISTCGQASLCRSSTSSIRFIAGPLRTDISVIRASPGRSPRPCPSESHKHTPHKKLGRHYYQAKSSHFLPRYRYPLKRFVFNNSRRWRHSFAHWYKRTST